MPKSIFFVCIACLALSLFAVNSHGEDTQREPSFYEFSSWNHRYPDEDTNIDLYMRHWRDSHIHVGHGGFIEREYLFPGDPLDPPKPGAVLKYLKAYNHGTLEARCITSPTKHDKEQVFFFIIRGEGTVESGGGSTAFTDGSGVFVPAGIEYRFHNTTDGPVEAVIIVEEISPGFEPLGGVLVGNYRDSTPRKGGHWAHIWRTVLPGMKFSNPIGIGVTFIDPFDIAQPHVHSPGTEEIWTKISGDSLLLFGNRLRTQHEGEAFLIPPNGKVPHMSINHTDKPQMWLYLGNRHDNTDPEDSKKLGAAASFDEFAPWSRRNPEIDANIRLYMHNWRDSKRTKGHGGFIEYPVLTPGDPTGPKMSGAVLKYIKAYNHGTLPGGRSTEVTVHPREQVMFVVESGTARVDAGGKSELIEGGSGVFIPAGLEYRFINTSSDPLETVIIVEETGEGFEPISEMKVGNYHSSRPDAGFHWAHIGRGLISGAKYYNPINLAVVSIDAFDIAQPHIHNENTEEIWYQYRGRSLAFFGNTLHWMKQGEAFLVPPDGRSVQCSINPSDDPIMFIYFGNRRDTRLPGNEHKRIE